MINEFSPEVISEIDYYVYRLIDPRNGNTFYVGKGRGNRVFAHMNDALAFEGDEDAASTKISLIRKIRQEGLEVIHVIHRHGLDGKTALEVEAALIDAYPGLSNIKGGLSVERGAMNAQQIQNIYHAETIEKITDKCIIIKVAQRSIDDNNGDIYEATRAAWKLNLYQAKKADYVLSVVNGIVKNVYGDLQWSVIEDWARKKFDGKEAPEDVKEKYVGKLIPPEYRKRGVRAPCRYVNC